MAEYDGSIRINTQIITENAKKDFQKISEEIKSAKESVSQDKEGKELEKLILKAREYAEKKKELKQQGLGDSKEFNKIQKQWEIAEEEIQKYMRDHMNLTEITESYKRQLDSLRESGYGFGDQEFDAVYKGWKNATQNEKEYAKALDSSTENSTRKLQEQAKAELEKQEERYRKEKEIKDIKEQAIVADQRTVELMEELTMLEKRRAELKKAGVTAGYQEYEEISERLEEINEELNNSGEKFEETSRKAKKGMEEIGKSTKKAETLLGKFGKKLKAIAITAFVVNTIRKLFNKMVSEIGEGFNNVVQYSQEYNKTMSELATAQSQFKNAIGAAFAPLINIAVPALTTLINYLIQATNAMAQFIAMLSGASTWTKALAIQKDYAKSLNKTGASAKKAAGALASFDTIEVLSKKDSGGGGEISPAEMFTEEAIDPKTITIFDELKNKLKEISDIFKKGFSEGVGDDIQDKLENIKESAKQIYEDLIDIFSSEEVAEAAENTFKKIVYAAGQISGAAVSVTATLGELIVGGISKAIEDNKEFVKDKLVNILDITGDIAEIAGNSAEAFANIFSVFGGDNAQAILGDLIGIVTDSVLELVELAGSVARDVLNVITQPFIDNQEKIKTALDGLLGTVSSITETIAESVRQTAEKVSQVYEQHFKPFFDSLADGLSKIQSKFLDLWIGNVQPILDQWANKFNELWENAIQPVINNFIDLMGDVADMLKVFWETILVPLILWIMENVVPVIVESCDNIFNTVVTIVEGIATTIDFMIEVLRGITEFLIGVFTGDWDKAWSGIGKIVETTGNFIKKIINTIISAIEGLVNATVDAINKLIDLINSINFSIPDWLPGLGGKSIGFNLQHIGHVSLPKLADGAVLRGGNPFMAILGDQPHGQTNIEAPLSTIEQAVENALNRRGTESAGSFTVNLNYDGETFARLSMDNWIAEANRRGYDIEILGGNT